MTTQQQDIEIMATEGGSGAWADLTPAMYPFTITGIEDVGVSELYPSDGPRLKVEFRLDETQDENGQPITIYDWCSQKVSGGAKPSKLFKWAEGLGLNPQPGTPFKVSSMLNRSGNAFLDWNKEKTRLKVVSIVPTAPAQPAARRAPLAQRVAPAPAAPAPAEAADSIGLCIVCEEEGTAYAPSGKVVCEAHKAMVK